MVFADTFHRLTSAGPGAIAVLGLRGDGVGRFAKQHLRRKESWTDRTPGEVVRATLCDAEGQAIDDVLVSTHAPAPRWDLRLHLHGSPWLVRQTEELLRAAGLTADDDGAAETLWGREPFLEAEAYGLLPTMLTLRGTRWLLDQPRRLRAALAALRTLSNAAEVDDRINAITARQSVATWFARPLRVAVVGPPNAGKSTLVNALTDQPVSLVSDRPGTTRDWVEAQGEVEGFPFAWLDTAGMRATADALEQAGIEQTKTVLESADAVVVVADASADNIGDSLPASLRTGPKPTCVALNKCDLLTDQGRGRMRELHAAVGESVLVSATCGDGFAELARALRNAAGMDERELDDASAYTPRIAARLADLPRDPADLSERLGDPGFWAGCGASIGVDDGLSTDE